MAILGVQSPSSLSYPFSEMKATFAQLRMMMLERSTCAFAEETAITVPRLFPSTIVVLVPSLGIDSSSQLTSGGGDIILFWSQSLLLPSTSRFLLPLSVLPRMSKNEAMFS